MISSSVSSLISQLISASNSKKIKWEQSSLPEEYITKDLLPCIISIKAPNPILAGSCYVFSIINEMGQETVRISVNNASDNEYHSIRTLYEVARNSSVVAETLVQNLLAKLNSI